MGDQNEDKEPEGLNVLNAGQGGRPGIRTSEFWIAVAMNLLGAWLIAKGKDELGAMLIAIGGGGYTGARAYVKSKVEPRRVS